MTRTTSASPPRGRARASRTRPRRTRARAPLGRRRRARAWRRGRPSARVSGRRAPGIATTAGERSSSHASATSAGVAPARRRRRRARRWRARPPARRGPPSGECAIRAMPGLDAPLDDSAAERAVVERAERDLDGRDRGELERLVQLAAVDVRDPDAAHEAFVDEARQRAHGGSPRRARIGRVDQVEVDRAGRRAQRGSPRSRRGSPSRGRPGSSRRRPASCRPSSRSARPRPRRSGGARGRAAARCGRARSGRGRTPARCRTP